MKAKSIILDTIKDHAIPCDSIKSNAFEMWASLAKLYQSSNENRKMVLREMLRNIKMAKTEIVSSYLTRITQVHDELSAVGEAITDGEFVITTLNGFQRSGTPFLKMLSPTRTVPTRRYCGMTSSTKRLVRRLFVADSQRVRRMRKMLPL